MLPIIPQTADEMRRCADMLVRDLPAEGALEHALAARHLRRTADDMDREAGR